MPHQRSIATAGALLIAVVSLPAGAAVRARCTGEGEIRMEPFAGATRDFVKADGARLYRFDAGLSDALHPLVDRIDRAIERLSADGWTIPGDRGKPLRIELVDAPGVAPSAGQGFAGAIVRVDVSGADTSRLDLLAPVAIHQVAHLVIGSDHRAGDGWWIESTARHLARRAEEEGIAEPVPPAEGIAGPQSDPAWGEVEFADAVAAAIGEDGLVRVFSERFDAPAVEGALRRLLEDETGATLEEFLLDHATGRELAPFSGSSALTAALPPLLLEAPAAAGATWSLRRFDVAGSGGGDFTLDPVSSDYLVRLVVSYAGAGRPADVLDLPAGVPVRVPYAGIARMSLLAVPRAASRAANPGVVIRYRSLPDFPFRLAARPAAEVCEGQISISWSTGPHTDLLGWRIGKASVEDGTAVFSGEIVMPTSDGEEDGFGYEYVDLEVEPERRYSYEVEAVTASGLLVEAFRLEVSVPIPGTAGLLD